LPAGAEGDVDGALVVVVPAAAARGATAGGGSRATRGDTIGGVTDDVSGGALEPVGTRGATGGAPRSGEARIASAGAVDDVDGASSALERRRCRSVTIACARGDRSVCAIGGALLVSASGRRGGGAVASFDTTARRMTDGAPLPLGDRPLDSLGRPISCRACATRDTTKQE
jgi:hypothetical protein